MGVSTLKKWGGGGGGGGGGAMVPLAPPVPTPMVYTDPLVILQILQNNVVTTLLA